jgi:hypothetical protein
VVAQEFEASGDFLKGNGLAILGQMLDRGVKVSLLYGDRDYQCNCTLSFSSSYVHTDSIMQGSAVKLSVSPSTPVSQLHSERQAILICKQTLRILVV